MSTSRRIASAFSKSDLGHAYFLVSQRLPRHVVVADGGRQGGRALSRRRLIASAFSYSGWASAYLPWAPRLGATLS